MISRFVAIALLCGSSLVLHVPVARGQGLVPTFGEFSTGHISDAINAAPRRDWGEPRPFTLESIGAKPYEPDV